MAEKKDFMDATKEKIMDLKDRTKDRFMKIEDSAETYIKNNPVKSTLISLGAGVLIGAGIALGAAHLMSERKKQRSFWHKYNPFE